MSREPDLTGINHWQRAIDLATRRHKGQLRDNGATPYVSHPMRVAMTLVVIFGIEDERILAAGAMHDLIEDTTVDHDEIAELFDDEIASWVSAVSKDMRLPHDAREEAYDQALRAAPWQAKLIKLADVYDNLVDSIGSEKLQSASRKADRMLMIASVDEELRGPASTLDELRLSIQICT